MPAAAKKKATKKRAAARKKTAAQVQAEEDLKWERWQKRIVSLLLAVICLAVAVNELLITDKPSETRLVAALTVLGFPLVLAGVKRDKP